MNSDLIEFEKYETRKIHRTQIKGAEYNPRTIKARNLKKLKKNIKRIGLLQPPIWNETTGTIVGGHQRIRVLDDLAGGLDYKLTVCVVNLSEKEEKEQNIFLNSPEAQGEFDEDRLAKLYREDGLDYDATGFEKQFLATWLGDTIFDENPAELQEIAERYRKLNEAHQKSIQNIEERDDPNFMARIVFENETKRNDACVRLGIDDPGFVNGDWFVHLCTGGRPAFMFVCDHCQVEQPVPTEASAHKCESCGQLFEIDWTEETIERPAEADPQAVPADVVKAAEDLLKDDGRFAPISE